MSDTMSEALTSADCITHFGDGCEGSIEYRMSVSPTGISYPRCDKAWNERLDLEAQINERYPDTPHAPSWFDSTYAGECWDDDY